MKKGILIKLLNILFFIIAIYANYLSIVYKIGGKSIRELSDKYENLFTPSNGTFAIWSLIYLLLLVFLIVQFSKQHKETPTTNNFYFIASCIFNFSWIIFWQYEYLILSFLVMIGLLYVLAKINQQILGNQFHFLKIVFGIYLGWICVATVANATALLVSMNPALGIQQEIIITLVILLAACSIVFYSMYKLSNPYLVVSLSWAFYGIYLKRATDHPVIAYTALILAVLGVGYFVYQVRLLLNR